jgi:hypothetical protein
MVTGGLPRFLPAAGPIQHKELDMPDEKRRLTINRIIFTAVGAFAAFVVMSASVVNPAKLRIADLEEQLDNSVYEAGRLLANAQAEAGMKDFEAASETLDQLFTRHPGSPETVTGRLLASSLAEARAKDDTAWELAVVAIQRKWTVEATARLRAEAEKDLANSLEQEWNRATDGLRAEWSRL